MLKSGSRIATLGLSLAALLVAVLKSGAVEPVRPIYAFKEEITATATHAEASAWLGWSTATAGNYLAVGAVQDDEPNSGGTNITDAGAVYLYTYTWDEATHTATKTLAQKLISPNPRTTGYFGYAVSMTKNHLVVGAPGEGSAANDGRAYVYSRGSDGSWELTQTLQTPNTTYRRFGCSVSVDRNLLAVGSTNVTNLDNLNDGSGSAGRAYLYELSGGSWGSPQTFNSFHTVGITGGTLNTPLTTDSFGASVAVQDSLTYGRRLFVAAPMSGSHEATANPTATSGVTSTRAGAVWIYEAAVDGSSWTGAAIAHPNNAGQTYPFALNQTRTGPDRFGTGLSASGNTLAIGGRHDYTGGNNAGAVSLYVRSNATNTWAIQQEINNSIGSSHFGTAVALKGDVLTVGSPSYDLTSPSVSNAGRVFFYARTGTTWTLTNHVTASSPVADDVMGWSVAMGTNVAFAASYGREGEGVNNSGTVYLLGSDNYSPIVQSDKSLTTPLNTEVWLGLTPPTDPDSDTVTITVTALPTSGEVQLGGTAVTVGQLLTDTQLTNLAYVPATGVAGPTGTFSYDAADPYSGLAAQTVTLKVQPLAPTSLTAEPYGEGEIDLSWDAVTGATSYAILRSEADGGPYTVQGSVGSGSTFYEDMTTTPGIRYYYVVAAVATGVSSDYSNQADATAHGPKPDAPTGLTATGTLTSSGGPQMTLSWTHSGDDVTSFAVYRFDYDEGRYLELGAVAATERQYVDEAGLTPNNYYDYIVEAVGVGGVHSDSSTEAYGLTRPGVVTNLTAAQWFTNNEIEVRWDEPTDWASGFVVLRSTNETGPFTVLQDVGGTYAYYDEDVQPGKTYYYQVIAYNDSGEGPASPAASATLPLPAPYYLDVVTPYPPYGSTELDLYISGELEEEGEYRIYRSESEEGTYTQVGTAYPECECGGEVYFLDDELQPSTTYYYKVTAYLDGVESEAYGPVSGTTLAPPPNPPTNLTVTTPPAPDGRTKLNLTWTDNSDDEVGFIIFWSDTGELESFVPVGAVEADVTSFQDVCLEPNTTNYYVVVAVGEDGGASDEVVPAFGTTLPLPPAAPTNGSAATPAAPTGRTALNLTWTDNSTDETAFAILRSATVGGPFTEIATVGAGVTSYQNLSLTANTTYCYQVVARNTGGDSEPTSFSGTTLATSAPSIPSSLTVTTPTDLVGMDPRGLTQLDLKWVDASSNETGFVLERSLDGVAFTAVATLPANSTQCTDLGLTPGTRYIYRILSVLNVTRSTASLAASGSTLFQNTETAPVITNIRATSVSLNGATLTWNTNIAASCRLVYRLNGVQQGMALSNGGTPGTSHSVTLTGLTAAKTYHYEIIASKLDGMSNEVARSTSNEQSFTTATVTGTVHTGVSVIRDGSDLWVTLTLYNGTANPLASSSIKSCSMVVNGSTVTTLSTVPVALGALPAGGQATTTLRFNGAAGTRGAAATLMVGFSAGSSNGTSTLRVTLP